jgi:hypothetical protein
MDNVLIVVDDLAAAIAFFVELGMELEGETAVEGESVDQLVGLDGVRADIAVVRTPDGHGRVELTKFPRRRRSAPSPRMHRRTRWAYGASRSPSTTSRTSLPACAPTAPNSSASWSNIRTAIGSVTFRGPEGIIVALAEQLS